MQFPKKYLPKKGLILDAGGGPCKYTVELAKQGYDVVLLDLAPVNLEFVKRQMILCGMADIMPIILHSKNFEPYLYSGLKDTRISWSGRSCDVIHKNNKQLTPGLSATSNDRFTVPCLRYSVQTTFDSFVKRHTLYKIPNSAFKRKNYGVKETSKFKSKKTALP